MTVLINGRGYFGRFIVPAGATGDRDHLCKVMREAGWFLPDPGHSVLPGVNETVDPSVFYSLNTSIGGAPVWVWPMCAATETRCDDARLPGGSDMRGYVCPVPWPLGSGCHPIDLYGTHPADTIPIPTQSPQFAPIPNTIPFNPRKDKDGNYTHASEEPYPNYGNDYDRTVWVVSRWDGPTGDYDLNYSQRIVSDVYATAYVYDLWDETGAQICGPAFVPPPMSEPPRIGTAARLDTKAKFAQAGVTPEAQTKARTGLMWIGVALAISAGAVVYYNRKDAKAELQPNPVGDADDDAALSLMRSEADYLLDGEPVDMEEFFDANVDGLHPEEVQEILNLKPGEKFLGGGGAWAEWSIERVN